MSGSRPTARSPPEGLPERVLGEIEAHLRERELRREGVYDRARRLRRRAQQLMRRLHEGSAPAPELLELRREASGFAHDLASHSPEESHLAHDALQECAEAILLEAVIRGAPLPGPAELGLPAEPYLLGAGDLVGEIRRLTLRSLADDRLEEAEGRLALMEKIYHDLMRFDAPRSILSMKPKQDAARALLERTRGEVTMAQVLARAHLPGGPRDGGAA